MDMEEKNKMTVFDKVVNRKNMDKVIMIVGIIVLFFSRKTRQKIRAEKKKTNKKAQPCM